MNNLNFLKLDNGDIFYAVEAKEPINRELTIQNFLIVIIMANNINH